MNFVLLDTGPLVALLDPSDQHHDWAVEQSKQLSLPWNSCEAVLTEAFFLLARVPRGREKLVAALRKPGLIHLPWNLDQERKAGLALMEKYADTPASLADVCLVRMAEANQKPLVWTTDGHFTIYRLRGNRKLPVLLP